MKKTKKLKINFGRLTQKSGKVLYAVVLTFLVLVAGVIALSTLNIPGNIKLMVVQSGSMEPKIKMGSVVAVKPETNYKIGDVITVKDAANPKNTLTHRIFDIKDGFGQTFYITKGDANNAPDSEARPKENVLGKVIFSVPFIGYPISFGKTREGLLLLIIIPATIIIYSELMAIKNEAQRLIKERRNQKLTFGQIRKLLVVLLILGIPVVGITKAYLSNSKTISTTITAGTWDDPTPAASLNSLEIAGDETPTPEATISPEPSTSPNETPTASAEATPTEIPSPTPESTP